MTIWLVRAGSHGEHQQKFIQEKKIFVTWSGLDVNLSTLSSKVELIDAMQVRYPNAKPKAILKSDLAIRACDEDWRFGSYSSQERAMHSCRKNCW